MPFLIEFLFPSTLITKIYVHNGRALVGGGAGGAIAPPTFLDLLNRYQFLPKNSNFFISTSTPKSFSTPNLKKPMRALQLNNL